MCAATIRKTMNEFLLAAAVFVLATVAAGLARIILGPDDADRMMAAQLLGTGGVATLLLLAEATGAGEIVDVALIIALLSAFSSVTFYLLSAFSSVTFYKSRGGEQAGDPRNTDPLP